MKRGLLLSEFFKIVNDQKTDEERFNLLKSEPSPIVKAVLELNFHPNIHEQLVRIVFPDLLPAKVEPVKKKRGRPKKENVWWNF